MNKRLNLILTLIILCGHINITAQKKGVVRRSYMSKSQYIKMYGNKFSKADSLNFIIRENDTLVLLSGNHTLPKGVSVPYEPKDSTFLEIYKDIVYKKYSKDSTQKRKPYMRLWNKPIKIFFSESLDKDYKDVITKLALKITKEVDSLNISFVDKLEKSNYIVYQIDENHTYKYSKNIRKNKYIDFYNYWDKNKIDDTKLEINVLKYKNKKVNANYLMQYFIKSLGHFYTTTKLPCKDILSNCNSSKKKFTKQDLEILKYHYSYGICKGTDLKTFENQHKKAKELLKKKNRKMSFLHPY